MMVFLLASLVSLINLVAFGSLALAFALAGDVLCFLALADSFATFICLSFLCWPGEDDRTERLFFGACLGVTAAGGSESVVELDCGLAEACGDFIAAKFPFLARFKVLTPPKDPILLKLFILVARLPLTGGGCFIGAGAGVGVAGAGAGGGGSISGRGGGGVPGCLEPEAGGGGGSISGRGGGVSPECL